MSRYQLHSSISSLAFTLLIASFIRPKNAAVGPSLTGTPGCHAAGKAACQAPTLLYCMEKTGHIVAQFVVHINQGFKVGWQRIW